MNKWKKEKVFYKCLSEKDKKELWEFKAFEKSNPTLKVKYKSLDKLDKMSLTLKGKSYQTFLNSEYWQIVREKVLKRDKRRCVVCKSDKYLQVHHEHYKYHFSEHRHMKCLMTLCRDCHKEHHYAQM